MIEHIVKNNENLIDILNEYHIDVEQLKEYNSHITDFNNLVSGTKLMIPLISEEIEQILEKTETFVMDYYPKISDEIIPPLLEEKKVIVNEVQKEEEEKEEPKKDDTKYRTPYPGIIPPKNPYKGR